VTGASGSEAVQCGWWCYKYKANDLLH